MNIMFNNTAALNAVFIIHYVRGSYHTYRI